MVVMPMGRDDQFDSLTGINADIREILERLGNFFSSYAGIDDDPRPSPNMQDSALSITRPE